MHFFCPSASSRKGKAVSVPTAGTVGLCLALLVAGCAQQQDRQISQTLPGVWEWNGTSSAQSSNIRLNFSISPSGDFSRQTFMSTNDVPFVNGIDMTGTFQVKNGWLIQTIKDMKVRRNHHLPLVLRAKILAADDREISVRFENAGDVVVLKKVHASVCKT